MTAVLLARFRAVAADGVFTMAEFLGDRARLRN
jgi:hypothetical protein